MNIKITKEIENIYKIEELDYSEHCNCYLIIGESNCLLIDCGIGFIDFNSILKKLARDKKLIVVLTHFHYDHFGGADNFKEIFGNKCNLKNKDIGLKYLNKNDFVDEKYFKLIHNKLNINETIFVQIKEGNVFEIGNFKFEALFTPGHDPTSICLFDKNKKILFSGDLIYSGELYYDLKDSDKKQYKKSLKKIMKLKPNIIFGGHNETINKNVNAFIQSKLALLNT